MQTPSLEQFVEQVSGTSHLRVEHDFGDGFVRLCTSEAERRQAAQDIRSSEDVIIELLRNSRDAHATHIFVATYREGSMRHLVVIDDGDGIPTAMHDHVFEPRVTSKLDTAHHDKWGMHGRGMALYSVKVNVEDAHVASSGVGLGCAMSISSNTATLGEKADQSSFPVFLLDDNGKVNVRGPKNILRCSCEFAIEERATCSVFVGSPTEIAATLYEYGMATLSVVDRAFCRNVEELPLVKRLATAGDPETFVSLANDMGLSLSTRSARRILDGQIGTASSLVDQVVIEKSASRKRSNRASKLRQATPKISAEDRRSFAQETMSSFEDLAERYYLDANVEPATRVANGMLTLRIPLVPKDGNPSPN